VIQSDTAPRPGAAYFHYRCDSRSAHLNEWLRKQGIDGLKPLHTLRKEFGSQLCEQFGIYAASRALSHSSIAISAEFYTDSTARGTIGLGHLLAGKKKGKIVPIKEQEEPARKKRKVK
jgi:hypothetical protein